MNSEFLESLDLFRMPPPLVKKTKDQKKQEQLIQSQYRDFYRQSTQDEGEDTEMLTDEEREKRMRDKERQEQNKKKEQHLKRMDDMKRLMINEIMRRGNEMVPGGQMLYNPFGMDFEADGAREEDTAERQQAEKERQEQSRDKSYFKELVRAVEVEFKV